MKIGIKKRSRYCLIFAFLFTLTLLLAGCVFSHCTVPPDDKGIKANPEREARMRRDVNFLSRTCYMRSSDSRDNQIKARDYLTEELNRNIKNVTLQPFTAGDETFWNIRAAIPGRTGERIVVGAHYDSCGTTPGADDNASGVAGILELARMLKDAQPEQTIELVLYANEEPPWFGTDDMGSARHVQQLAAEPDTVTAMICLEMIGYFDENKGSQSYPVPGMGVFYPSRGNFIAIIGNMGSLSLAQSTQRGLKPCLPTVRLNFPFTGGLGLDFSDHRNYWKADIPAVMVTDTAFYRNHHYHKITDTPEILNYAKMGAVVQGVYNAVAELGGITQK